MSVDWGIWHWGCAKVSKQPVAVIVTSGTAVANFIRH